MEQLPVAMRLDKWLWVARFFKTRQLAVAAVNGGKVHLNGQRSKPGKDLRPGDRLCIHKGALEWELEVVALATQRRPAKEAALLYREADTSQARRAALLEEQRLLRQAGEAPGGPRPTKRDRRRIHRFTDNGD
jgi:ribosome-associated heat shock protein Hsp15